MKEIQWKCNTCDGPTLTVFVPEWVSVKDRLPHDPKPYETERYLVIQSEFWQEVSVYKGQGFWEHLDVTHWMPLPESPK